MAYERLKPSGAIYLFRTSNVVIGPMAAKVLGKYESAKASNSERVNAIISTEGIIEKVV